MAAIFDMVETRVSEDDNQAILLRQIVVELQTLNAMLRPLAKLVQSRLPLRMRSHE